MNLGSAFPKMLALVAAAASLLPHPSAKAGEDALAAVEAQVEAIRARHQLPGAVLLVSQRGEPVLARAYGSYALDQRLPIASASKWITASLLQRLVDLGYLHWDRPIGEYSARVPPERANLTLRQLMALTSGIPGGSGPAAAACLNFPLSRLETCALQILQLPTVGAPGEVFDYGGNSMQVAAWIAEQATGRSWDALFREHLAVPLGWAATDYGPVVGAALPNPRVAGGMHSTAPEYLQLLLFQQGFGQYGHRRMFDRVGVADANAVQTASTRVIGTPYPESAGYALGRWVDALNAQGQPEQLSSPGAFGFTPWVDLRLGIAAVFAVQTDLGGFTRMRNDLFQLQQLVAIALQENEAATPFADFAGVWWNPSENGAGLFLEQNVRGELVLSWYTFDADGSALWLVGTGRWTRSDRWEGLLYRAQTSARDTLRLGLDPATVTTTEFGSATLDFSGHSSGSLRLRTPGFEREIAIERFPF